MEQISAAQLSLTKESYAVMRNRKAAPRKRQDNAKSKVERTQQSQPGQAFATGTPYSVSGRLGASRRNRRA